ncbi:MAG: 4Fe-4S dicluster domain-containing protein [Bacteroidetes bacterium]|nr:4Fe-4S dicluster domain-containing protein [Bacteroidota bacterium]
MDIEKKLLRKSSLSTLVNNMRADGKTVFAPTKQNTQIAFTPISSLEEMTEDYIVTNQSPKSVAFPKTEKLLNYQVTQFDITNEGVNPREFPEVVVLGARPCDAAGFESLTAIFTWDYHDFLYTERLKKTVLIGISCAQKDDYCFCTSVKGSPGSTRGSDILLTKVDNGDYLAEIITEKGKSLAGQYPALFEDAPEVDKEKYLARVPVKFDVDTVVQKSGGMFESDIWLEQSFRCIGCGACAYVCPTCACFDIQDESAGSKGQRLRCWDSCGFKLFTIHTSGHNPREVQSQRWRQRVLHKFSYMPDRLNVTGCIGCGRCGRACPVDMNLSEHLVNIAQA